MKIFSAILVLALSGCQHEPVEIPIGIPGEDECGAVFMQNLVGQHRSVLDAMGLDPARTRIFGSGDAITMDFSPSRLNVEIAADGKIARIYCG